ncbi:hypothetical protein MMC29_004833 [Sticta canariensis]|nr:hypothetical protein [Sticta canariensis]
MSPPEAKPLDSFCPTLNSVDQPYKTQSPALSPDNKLAPISTSHSSATSKMRIFPSPPASPFEKPVYKRDPMDGGPGNIPGINTNRDPVLYPADSDVAEIPADQPLFPSEPSMEDETVARHISMHMAQFDKKLNRPTREEYLLALSCIPNIGRIYNRNPGAYMKRTHDETEDQYWKAKRICAKPGTKAMPLVNIAPAPQVKQPKRAIKSVAAGNPIPRVKRTPKASPKARMLAYSPKGRSATPETRTPATKRPEDVDYRSLPDYSPSTSTLPKGNPKCLKADWPSSNLLNLSNDPDRAMLHEAELNLASILRLSCATYLCSKRRIFEARLNALRIHKEFRKTDAQQACKIDVNKASKLWTAYDKVGWFNEAYFEPFL